MEKETQNAGKGNEARRGLGVSWVTRRGGLSPGSAPRRMRTTEEEQQDEVEESETTERRVAKVGVEGVMWVAARGRAPGGGGGGVLRRSPHAHEDTRVLACSPRLRAAEEPRNLTGSTFASSS